MWLNFLMEDHQCHNITNLKFKKKKFKKYFVPNQDLS